MTKEQYLSTFTGASIPWNDIYLDSIQRKRFNKFQIVHYLSFYNYMTTTRTGVQWPCQTDVKMSKLHYGRSLYGNNPDFHQASRGMLWAIMHSLVHNQRKPELR